MWRGLVQAKCTPLHLAAMNAHSEAVQLLLSAKGNANAEDVVSDWKKESAVDSELVAPN